MVRLPTTLLAACGLLAGRALGALEVNLDDHGLYTLNNACSTADRITDMFLRKKRWR